MEKFPELLNISHVFLLQRSLVICPFLPGKPQVAIGFLRNTGMDLPGEAVSPCVQLLP